MTSSASPIAVPPSGPVLVVGGPGSGKTTLVVEATVAALEARRDGQGQPLVLTFSRLAASSLRNRITSRLGRTTSPPLVMTMHAFCLWLLRRGADPGSVEPRLLTAPEQEFRVRELLSGRGVGAWPSDLAGAVPTRVFARQVRAVLARARQLGLDPEDVVAVGAASQRPEWVSAGHFFDEYLDVLDHEGALDYAELVHRARILLTEPALLEAVRGDISQVIVDEYAESDPSQIGLLRALIPPGGRILAVGDPDQAIFGFRGSHPRALSEFPDIFRTSDGSPAPIHFLDGHRGSPALRAAWASVARRLPLPPLGGAATRALRPDPPGADPASGGVAVYTCGSESAQAELIARELRRAQLDDGLAHGEMAVLVRSGRHQLAPIARALVAAGVPVEIAGDEIPLSAEQAVRPLLLALQVVQRGVRLDADEARRLVTSPLVGLDAVALRTLGRALLAAEAEETGAAVAHRGPEELMADAIEAPSRLDALQAGPEVAALRGFVDLLSAAAAILAVPGNGAGEVLWQLWSGTSWPADLHAESLRGGELGRRADRDLDAVRALFNAAAATEQPAGPGGIAGFLAEVAAQEIPADTARESEVTGRGVRLLTAHRAKGREWPLVVVAGVQEGSWPDLGRGGAILAAGELVSDGLVGRPDRRELIADERRLFYVACSRATRRLVVTAVTGAEGEANQPSRFIAELGVGVQTYHPDDRPLTLQALAAELRRTATSIDSSDALRRAAASRLAALSELRDADDRQLVPAADPAHWWGVLESTGGSVASGEVVRMSATQLTELMTCPRSYFLSRRVNAEPARSTATSLGSVIHVLAEHARADGLTAEQLNEKLGEIWDEIPFDAAWMSASERADAEAALARFVNWQELNAHAEVIGVEVPFEVDVEIGEATVRLNGSVDRLERTSDGRLRVIDFKTGRRTPTRAQVDSSEQLGLYQLAIDSGAFDHLTDGPHRSAGGSLVYLRAADGAEYPKVFHQAALSEQTDSTWVQERIAEAVNLVRTGSYAATPGDGCRYCPFTSSCPAQPAGRQVIE